MFWLDDSLGATIYLDGIITVVDAVNIDHYLNTRDSTQLNLSAAHLQISHADVLVVNKVDLVSEARKNVVVERVLSINSIAKVFQTEYARLDGLDAILDLHSYDSAEVPINESNRDSHSHIDPVFSSPFPKLTTAYLNCVIRVSPSVRRPT